MKLVERNYFNDLKQELNNSFDELLELLEPAEEPKRTDGYLCKDLVNIDNGKIRLKTAKLMAILDELDNIEEYKQNI